jgi:hypothetical protein
MQKPRALAGWPDYAGNTDPIGLQADGREAGLRRAFSEKFEQIKPLFRRDRICPGSYSPPKATFYS